MLQSYLKIPLDQVTRVESAGIQDERDNKSKKLSINLAATVFKITAAVI